MKKHIVHIAIVKNKIIKMNISMKERVLRFVESKGAAKFTEIQEFIVDFNKGVGTYKTGYRLDHIYLEPSKKNPYGRPSAGFPNIYRGYYCSAFSGPNPWFIYGYDHLEKREDGKWIVMRNKFKERPEHHYWNTHNYKIPNERN